MKAPVLRTFQLMVHGRVFYKNWFEIERTHSSRGVKVYLLRTPEFQHMLSSHTVKWFANNQAVKSIIDSGSMKVHLHKLDVDIFLLC